MLHAVLSTAHGSVLWLCNGCALHADVLHYCFMLCSQPHMAVYVWLCNSKAFEGMLMTSDYVPAIN
jgi:hypothetical protein